MTNIIVANLAKSRFYRASPVYQYNYGMKLVITGLELPTAYEVDFANDINGSSITQVGGADGVVPIPSQLFIPGQAIYCWLREHPTPDSSVTTAITVIPISPRATITDEEPTPVEQSAIDEAIAALNDAVDKAEDAVEHYPQITNGVWYVWDVDAGEYVSTGIPAQGAQGNPGVDGQDGTDGFSPTASVVKSGNTATITITDKSGTTTAQVTDGTNGAPGADGFSPVATVTQTASGATISITDKTGTTTANIANGQDGSPGQPGQDGADGVGVPAGGTTGQVLAKSSGADYSTEWLTPYTGTIMETVSGATPTITAQDDHRYVCGEVSTLDITLPASGIVDVVFQSGSTATVLTITPPTGVALKWANGFDPTSLEANTTYEINIMDGLGVGSAWT